MKIKRNVLAVCVALIAAAPFLTQRALGQRVETVNRAPLPGVENLTDMRVDDEAEATGIPRPDLVIKDMCFGDSKSSVSYVGVLIANVGTADAGPFELGYRYLNSEGAGSLGLDKVEGGLKVGEERWMQGTHICCGWAPQSLSYGAVGFEAIADPRYRTKGFAGFPPGEVKPVIPESNEGNNKMAAKKSEMRSCDSVDKKVDTRTPSKLEPVRPRKP